MLSCKEVGELLSQGIDRKLKLREKVSLKLHLVICKTCSCYEKQLQFVAHSAHRLMRSNKDGQGIPPLSDEAGIRITRNIKQQLNEEQQQKKPE